VKNQDSNNCDSHIRAYKNAKQWRSADKKQEKPQIYCQQKFLTLERFHGKEELTHYDELVYKLTLKYLRQKGYDIGKNTIPRIKDIRDASVQPPLSAVSG
jgi:hypothetical protein